MAAYSTKTEDVYHIEIANHSQQFIVAYPKSIPFPDQLKRMAMRFLKYGDIVYVYHVYKRDANTNVINRQGEIRYSKRYGWTWGSDNYKMIYVNGLMRKVD